MKRSEKCTEFYRYKNNKCIRLLINLRYYTIIINEPTKNKIRTIKCGEGIIDDIDLHKLLDIIPENSNLENVLTYKNNVFFYFNNFGYLKIKSSNLINKKKSKIKNNWKPILEERYYNPKIKIPNNFDRLINTGYKSFALFKSNLDIPYWNILTITDIYKPVDIDLYRFLLKLGISVDYNVMGLALDEENEMVYMKLKNKLNNFMYIYSDLNSDYKEYYNWHIISNIIGDNTMDEKEVNEIEKNIDFELKTEEEINSDKETLSDLYDDIDKEIIDMESKYDEKNEFFKNRKQDEKIINDLDNFIKDNAYFDNGIPTIKKFIKNIGDKEIYFDDLNTVCSKFFAKEVKNIDDKNFRTFVSSVIGNKAFDSFKDMLYIAEIFTKNNPFKYYNDYKSIEINGFSAFDSYYSETENSEIYFETSFEILRKDNRDENNIGLKIELTIYTKYQYIDENNETIKRIIPIGTVISNIDKLDNPYENSDKYLITVPNVTNNLFDYAKTITYIEQSVYNRCINCSNIGKDCCLKVGGPLKNDEVNINIRDGYIPVSDKVIDFLKNSKKLTADIYSTCSVILNRE